MPSVRAARLVVPAYFHPAARPAEWSWLADHAQQVRLVVLNLASGPGVRRDEAFLPVLARLPGVGVAVAAYVDTDYGRRRVADVAADLERYLAWYGVTGVFFDRAAAAPDQVAHYAGLADGARRLGIGLVAFNHGAHPSPGYADHADMLGTFEGDWRTYLDASVPRWVRSRPVDQFFHLVYSVPPAHLGDALVLAARRHAGGAYVTDHGGANPWDRLPTGTLDPSAA